MFNKLNVVAVVVTSPPLTARSPVTAVLALLIVVVPVAAPILIAVPAPNKLPVVTVVFNKLNVVAVVVTSPPLTAKSPTKVPSPALLTLKRSAAAAPFCINFNTKSKSSDVAVTSVVTASRCMPVSLLLALVSVINCKPDPIPTAGVPDVVC